MSDRRRWFAYIQTPIASIGLGVYRGSVEDCMRRAKFVQVKRGIPGAVCLTIPGNELPDPFLRDIINASHWRAVVAYRKNKLTTQTQPATA